MSFLGKKLIQNYSRELNWGYTTHPKNGANGATYGNGKFVAVSGDEALVSNDGINWNSGVIVAGRNFTSVTFGGGIFVAVSSGDLGGEAVAAYSNDGYLWQYQNLPIPSAYGVAFGNGKFVATGGGSYATAYSSNGINWTKTQLSGFSNLTGITFGNNKFVSGGKYSNDGVSWFSNNLNSDYDLFAYGNGIFLAKQSGPFSNTFAYSNNGIAFNVLPGPINISGIVYGDNKFVFFPELGGILSKYTTNGINLRNYISPQGAWLNSAFAFGDGRFVALGDYNNAAYTL